MFALIKANPPTILQITGECRCREGYTGPKCCTSKLLYVTINSKIVLLLHVLIEWHLPHACTNFFSKLRAKGNYVP